MIEQWYDRGDFYFLVQSKSDSGIKTFESDYLGLKKIEKPSLNKENLPGEVRTGIGYNVTTYWK